jgi:predicted DNA-binding transcriptional regulator YafY
MQMSERQWRVLSLLERLNRGEVTVGEVAASLKRSRRQVQRMRKRVAGKGAAGLVHGNAGRRPKHRTPEEVREQVLMLRRGKYDGCIAWASGSRPKPSAGSNRNDDKEECARE